MLPINGLYGHIRANTLKSIMLLAGFAALVAAYWFAACLAFSAIAHLFDLSSPPVSASAAFDQIMANAAARALANWHVPILVTAAWFVAAWLFYGGMIRAATGARPVSRQAEPDLYKRVERLAIAAGLPMPRVEIMETQALNAYAAGLGPDDATVAVTRGLLKRLEPRELDAVLAHEMVHIRNRDVRLMVFALIFAGGITLGGNLIAHAMSNRRGTSWSPGDFDDVGYGVRAHHRHGGLGAPAILAVAGALLIAAATLALTHIGAIMTRLAISRAREFMADAGAVELTKDPDALISALAKISGHDYVPGASDTMSAMMISSSFDEDDIFDELFSTHPSVAARISALSRHAGGMAMPPRRRFVRPQRVQAGG
jgi:heat shock protein HtpX